MALVTIRRSASVQSPRKTDETEKATKTAEEDVGSRISRSLNECYFASKGAALVLGGLEHGCPQRRQSPARAPPQPDIQHHLQAMFYLLRPEETLKMAVKLESVHVGRTRYLVVVCRADEAALLGIDCNERTTVGLSLRVLADTSIKLDGDGGFSVCVCNRQHIFKPVSVQAMWSALQTLHKASARARELNHFAGGTSHSWCEYYESNVDSDRSCLNEWHAMDSLESRRPPSPDSLRLKPHERDETERVIRCTLKEIMMSVDLDEVTSKVIRVRLEEELDMDLAEYKSFIDQEMLMILGQMDAPTEVFDHVYLGSEWNASNLEELQRNGVRHILNVTREIDNFFPGMFDYLNIRVYDDDKTDLLKHWDNTYKYINKARNEGSKVLVHCKMGISRSASVVIAYAMKAFNWNFEKALKHVKAKRNCIKPNTNFLNQLETYQGILDAMKNKEKLQRSKSETNLKAPKCASRSESVKLSAGGWRRGCAGAVGAGGRRAGRVSRPRSWSPDTAPPPPPPPTSVSLEHLAAPSRHMLMPCANGSYSVSPNQIIRLKEQATPRVRHLVHALERRVPPPEPDPPPVTITPAPASVPTTVAIAAPAPSSAPAAESDSGFVAEDEAPTSRRSSSSSGDSAVVPDLSRRSSWGSRRTLSANVRKFNETCAILRELAAAAGEWPERLSASAPPDTWLRGALRRRRAACASHGDLPTGLVSSLKREFEARSEGERGSVPRLPRPPPARPAAVPAPANPVPLAPPAPTVLALGQLPLDYSDVLVPAVMSKAQNKKQLQHGKTHPLTRLNLNRSNNRCSNPVYNTM